MSTSQSSSSSLENTFPVPAFSSARADASTIRLPQCIAHRGFRAKYPENTLAAFKGAVAAGAHALETDVHLTKDDVVVISHDPTLQRCFGRPEKIIDCTWDEIKDLKTLATPHETMPRLQDVLTYLSRPGLEKVWLFLDIKIDNDADDLMRLIASTIASVPEVQGRPWNERIVLGIWAAKYLPLAHRYSPGFPVFHIGFSVPYARHFFKIPKVSFNMLFPALVGPGGKRFLRDAKIKYSRQVLAWTVNDEDRMRWCIRQELDGVITDDPAKYLKVCKAYKPEEKAPLLQLTFASWYDVIKVWVWINFALLFYMKRFLPKASPELLLQDGKTKA